MELKNRTNLPKEETGKEESFNSRGTQFERVPSSPPPIEVCITQEIIEKIEELLQVHRETDPHQTAHLLAYHIDKMIANKKSSSKSQSDLSSPRTNTPSSIS